MLVYVNTCEDRVVFAVKQRGKIMKITLARHAARGTIFWRLVAWLEKKHLSRVGISGIIVAAGPGRFGAVREGVVIANAVGYALDVPVSGFRIGEEGGDLSFAFDSFQDTSGRRTIVEPVYDRPPHITC